MSNLPVVSGQPVRSHEAMPRRNNDKPAPTTSHKPNDKCTDIPTEELNKFVA